MFCPNCGSQAPDGANNCPNCGAALNGGANTNYGSGPINDGNQNFGTTDTFNNGANQYQSNNQQSQPNNGNPTGGERKSKLVAGLLGILLGGIGVHNFYLGNTTRGIIQIVVTFVTCGIGSLWGLIEGILILCGNINTDANGNPLTD